LLASLRGAVLPRSQSAEIVPSGFAYPPSPNLVQIRNKLTTRSLTGVVTDSVPSSRIPDVLVERVTKEGQRIDAAFSGGTGRFELKPVPDGDYILRFSLRGFDTVIVTVKVSKNSEKELRIDLRLST